MNCFFSVKSWCTCMYNTLGASFTLVFANEAKRSQSQSKRTYRQSQKLPETASFWLPFFFIVVPVERGVGAHCDDKLFLHCLQTSLLNFKGCHHDELIADWMLWGEST